MDMKYIIKDQKETVVAEPMHEVHILGCKDILRNRLWASSPKEAINPIEVIKQDMVGDETIADYKIMNCAK